MSRRLAVVAVVGVLGVCAAPPPAQALNVAKPVCTLGGLVSGVVGKICTAASHAGTILNAGKKLLGGHIGGAVETLAGTTSKLVGLAAVGAWVVDGAGFALHETAAVISSTTRPQLQSTWFSAYYWRMAAIAALLTLPFLFAACLQAVMRSDLAMLARSALLYLPLGVLAVSIAAPVTVLLLSAADELSSLISSAAGGADVGFLAKASFLATGLSVVSHDAFLGFFVALLTVAATVTLWVELLIRSAAVYVIVLMLPLFFAALVWPARRVWAVRAVELLVAVILSKFAIVAVLSLGGAALGHTLIAGPAAELPGRDPDPAGCVLALGTDPAAAAARARGWARRDACTRAIDSGRDRTRRGRIGDRTAADPAAAARGLSGSARRAAGGRDGARAESRGFGRAGRRQAAVTERRLTYTFGPLERRGLLGPIRGGQAAVLGFGVLLAIVALDSSPSATGALIALLACGAAVAASWAPVAGRTTQEWAPLVVSFAARRLLGRARFLSPAPTVGGLTRSEALVPAQLRGVQIMEASYQQRPIGVLSEASGRRLTAVIACRVLAFSLLDPEAQERRLARWGMVLSGAGGSAIRRIQWIERTSPSQGDELAKWLRAERDPAIPPRGTPMIESYLELIESSARVTQEHEILLAVQVDSQPRTRPRRDRRLAARRNRAGRERTQRRRDHGPRGAQCRPSRASAANGI